MVGGEVGEGAEVDDEVEFAKVEASHALQQNLEASQPPLQFMKAQPSSLRRWGWWRRAGFLWWSDLGGYEARVAGSR